MTIKANDRFAVAKELARCKAELCRLTRLNLEVAGTVVDVNALTAAGWKDQIKFLDGAEFTIGGMVNVEFAYGTENCEYRVVVSTSRAIKRASTHAGFQTMPAEELPEAYSGKMPRLAYMRWLYAYAIYDGKLELRSAESLPEQLFEKIEGDLLRAIRVPVKSFAEELEFQTREFAPAEEIANCSGLERQLLQLATIINGAFAEGAGAAVARLHVPLARVVFWNREGHAMSVLLRQLHSARVILALAPSVAYSQFNESAAVLFELLQNCDEYVFCMEDVPALESLALSLVRAKLPNCARCIVEELMELCYGNVDGGLDSKAYDALINVLWETQKAIKALPEVRGYGRDLQKLLRSMHRVWMNDIAWKTMDVVFDLYLGDGENYKSFLDKLAELAKEASRKYDARLSGKDDEWKKALTIAIKNPVVWQAFMYSYFGRPNRALKAFPEPVASTEEIGKGAPKHEAIMGLPPEEIWQGLFAKPFEKVAGKLNAFAKTLTHKKKAVELRIYEMHSTDASVEAVRVCEHPDAKARELSAVAVDGILEASNDARPLAVFPFLPAEHESFQTNVVAEIWKCYTWHDNSACEVKVKIDGGERKFFYAIMPYYATDKQYFMRGLKMTAKLCGFACSIEKDESEANLPKSVTVSKGPLVEEEGHPVEVGIDPDLLDTFDQDRYKSEFSRSGFFVHGRFVSKRIIKCFCGKVACVRIKCRRIDFDFDVYIAESKVDKSLKPGDPVNVYGWLYIDLLHALVKFADYAAAHPEGAPLDPIDFGHFHGVPSFVRTEWTEEEMRTLPREYCTHDWFGYALRYLSLMEGVKEVKPCKANAAQISFLVRQNGKTRRFAFFQANAEKPLEAQMQSVDTLVLTKTKHGEGVKLDWEIQSPHPHN